MKSLFGTLKRIANKTRNEKSTCRRQPLNKEE